MSGLLFFRSTFFGLFLRNGRENDEEVYLNSPAPTPPLPALMYTPTDLEFGGDVDIGQKGGSRKSRSSGRSGSQKRGSSGNKPSSNGRSGSQKRGRSGNKPKRRSSSSRRQKHQRKRQKHQSNGFLDFFRAIWYTIKLIIWDIPCCFVSCGREAVDCFRSCRGGDSSDEEESEEESDKGSAPPTATTTIKKIKTIIANQS